MSDWADSLREYARRVAGRDDSWKKHALCSDDANIEYQGAFLCSGDDWLVDDNNEWVTGYEAQKRVVEMFCVECPVQWECARWGVEVEEEVGVYALTVRDLRWLTKQGDAALGLIDQARITHTSVHVAVRRARFPHKPDAV